MSQLKRELGLAPAVATAVGIVVSSSALLMMGQGFGLSGTAFLIAMVIAAFTNLCVAFSFAELTSILPSAGGINHYTLPAMGPMMGIFAVVTGYFSVSILSNAAESMVAGTVIYEVFFGSTGLPPQIWALIMMTVLAAINLFGVKSFAISQIIFTATMIGSMIVLSCIGLFDLGSGTPLETPQWGLDMAAGGGVLSMLGIAFWLFVGLEFVCPMAEEVKNPRRFIPLAMIMGLAIIFVSDMLFGFAALKFLPTDELAASTTPHIDAATAILGRTGQVWIGIISLMATCSTLNTFIAAIPRMLYGMSKEGQFPKAFGKLNAKGSPQNGVILVWVITVILLIFFSGDTALGMINTFILSGCIGWMTAYIIAHINVIILRKKYPNANRAFKVPGGIVLPIISIVSLLYMMVYILPDATGNPINETSILIWQFIGVVIVISAIWSICWVKFKMKVPLFKTIPLEKLQAEINEE